MGKPISKVSQAGVIAGDAILQKRNELDAAREILTSAVTKAEAAAQNALDIAKQSVKRISRSSVR